MTCPKCTGCVITNHGETYCLNCAYRPDWGKPAPPDESVCGKYPRKGEKYTCKCGRSKVAWRSCCIRCYNRILAYKRTMAKVEQARRKRAVKKMFA